MIKKNLEITIEDSTIGRFQSLEHKKHSREDENPERFQLLKKTDEIMEEDGLNNLTYKLNKILTYNDHFHVFVDLLKE